MDALLRDLRIAWRALLHEKSYALTTTLTLAVCIAANAAAFAIVNSVLLRPLPFSESSSILLMANAYPKAGVAETENSSAGDYVDRLRETTVFEQQAMFKLDGQTIEIN